MKGLASFQNIHQNETIVVCGCGESLNELENPERFITIGVNDVGRKFQPNYLVVVNPKSQFSGDRFRFVETTKAEYIFTQLDLNLNIIFFNFLHDDALPIQHAPQLTTENNTNNHMKTT